MEQVIIKQNQHWQVKYRELFDRKVVGELVKYLIIKEIIILTGVRRSGKSTVFKLLINLLSDQTDPKKILFINCEAPQFTDLWKDSTKFFDIIQTAEKITGGRFDYLFIDEIQNVKNWEKFIKTVYETEEFKKIFITGSNSQLLENQYINLLSGRFVAKQIFPLSFLEILRLNGVDSYMEFLTRKSSMLRILDDYLRYGGFPEIYKITVPELKEELLNMYYQTIVLKDCIINQQIRDIEKFKQLSFFVFNNVGNVYTYNSLARAIDSNENTVQNFINALKNSFLAYEIRNFTFSAKHTSKSKKKLYIVDNGLINVVSYNFSPNLGKLLENAVFMEIIKSQKFDVFFYNQQFECDFVLKSKNKLFAVQVAYELSSANREREVNGLLKIAKQFDFDRLILVTYDSPPQIEGITTMSFVEFCFFLENFED